MESKADKIVAMLAAQSLSNEKKYARKKVQARIHRRSADGNVEDEPNDAFPYFTLGAGFVAGVCTAYIIHRCLARYTAVIRNYICTQLSLALLQVYRLHTLSPLIINPKPETA